MPPRAAALLAVLLLTGAARASSTEAAQGDPYAAMRGLYKRLDGEVKTFLDRGDYPGAVRFVWTLAEGQPGHQEQWFLFDLQASFLGFAGDDAGARLAMARSRHFTPRPIPPLPSASGSRAARAKAVLEEPEAVLARAAGTHRVIMISEAHHIAEHRAWGASVLPLLKKRGFNYLAMETLKAPVPEAPAGVSRVEAPGALYGYYAREPQMAGLIREALRLGFTLVAYEDETTGGGDREEIQARNLQERVFAKDPRAKAVVWAGYGHVYKRAPRPDYKPMARWFWEKTGIEPFSVFEESDSLDPHMSESPRYKAFVLDAAKPISRPAMLVSRPGLHPALELDAAGEPIVDAYLFHPPYGATTPSGLRPAWLKRPGFEPLGGSAPSGAFVQAFLADEGAGSTPADQAACAPSGRFELWLRPGDYILRALGEDGRVLSERAARPGGPPVGL